ncbi:MAG: hypothetical protein R3263_10235, partial [Myxococcota bacterium]|nr:hypothetical protein [Myxococcota bacterium]
HRGHGWGHAKRHPGHGWGHGKHHREHHHVRSHSARRHTGWLCRPCAHRFSSSYLFRRHLHLFHDVPPHRIPHVVVKVDLGWIFAG